MIDVDVLDQSEAREGGGGVFMTSYLPINTHDVTNASSLLASAEAAYLIAMETSSPFAVTVAMVALGALLCTFSALTVLGNLLVIGAVARERSLRSVTNYLVVSLAAADLIVGAIVMPFSVVHLLAGKGSRSRPNRDLR